MTVIATQLVRHTLTIAYAYHPGLPFADRGFSGDDDFVAQAISSEHLPQSRPFCASACDAFCLFGACLTAGSADTLVLTDPRPCLLLLLPLSECLGLRQGRWQLWRRWRFLRARASRAQRRLTHPDV